MLRVVLTRVVVGILILWVVSVIVFVGTTMLSGDAATQILGREATPESLAVLREQLHLDQPGATRYVIWFKGVLRGDVGRSLASSAPVGDVIGRPLRNTLLLAGVTALILIPLSYLLGTLAAVHQQGWLDVGVSTVTLALISLPEFVFGTLLVLTFAVLWPVLPAISLINSGDPIGFQAKALVLPVATLLAGSVAQTTRMVRAALLDVLDSEFVKMARLKGVPERRVIVRHALRNALVPSLQVMALIMGWLISGVVVVEFVFQYPGMGRALVDAVTARDVPVVQEISLILAAVYVVINLLADVAMIVLTPKLRTSL